MVVGTTSCNDGTTRTKIDFLIIKGNGFEGTSLLSSFGTSTLIFTEEKKFSFASLIQSKKEVALF